MPDPIFAHPRLAAVYDAFDDDRGDLDLYVGIARELRARSVLDLGCGTGALACRLAQLGIDVTGVDPAAASLDVAGQKPGAALVRWLHGTATDLSPIGADLAVMTGNVAQVFIDDEGWDRTLTALHHALRPDGWLVFETRVPSQRAWESWRPELTHRSVEVAGAGTVTRWTELVAVRPPSVTFRHVFRFEADESEITSESTLIFRSEDEIRDRLDAAGFDVEEVRDAPDRPGLEWVFLARRR